MNYWAARRAEKAIEEYLQTAEKYWPIVEGRTGPATLSRRPAMNPDERSEAASLRAALNLQMEEVRDLVRQLAVPTGYGYPVHSIMRGVTGDSIHDVTDPDKHHGYCRDTLQRAIGAARVARIRAKWRLVLPWFWLIDLLGLVLRFPFLVLRAAGLPPVYEQSIWAQAVKIAEAVVLAALAAALGVSIALR